MVARRPADRLPSGTDKPALGHAGQWHEPDAARRCRFLRVQPAGDELERDRRGRARAVERCLITQETTHDVGLSGRGTGAVAMGFLWTAETGLSLLPGLGGELTYY